MSIGGAIAVYFIIWWTVLFVALPFGVRSQAQTDATLPGTDPGAPVMPHMARKAMWTTIIAFGVFVIVYAVWSQIDL
jgi:predicted secreted protein